MSQGQGNVTFSGDSTNSGSGGGGLGILGAIDGLSLLASGSDFYVVLGQAVGEAGNPAILTNDREIPMNGNTISFPLLLDEGNQLVINPPLAFLLYESDSPELFDIWQPENYGTVYAPGGTANRFMSGYDLYPGVNEPNTARPNVVGTIWSYNTAFGMGRVDATEPSFRFSTETCFYIGADPYFEFHVPEMTCGASGDIHRIMSYYVNTISGIGFANEQLDNHFFFNSTSDPALGEYYHGILYDAAGDTSKLELFSLLSGGICEFTMGNYVDGVCFATEQGGIWNFNAFGSIALQAPTVFLNPTNETIVVNQMCIGYTIGNSAESDAILDLSTVTNRGFRLPVLTTAQRLAVATAGLGGLLVYDSTLNKIAVWNSAAWEIVTSV